MSWTACSEEIIQKYPVQTEQIYLTGLSMGGYGTWHWAARHPRAFAALVPICGGAMPLTGFPERAAVLKEVPIWAFHGEDDQIVPGAAFCRTGSGAGGFGCTGAVYEV